MWYVEDRDGRIIAQFCINSQFTKAIASIPAMVEEIVRLRAERDDYIGLSADLKTICELRIVEIESLRAFNAEMRNALQEFGRPDTMAGTERFRAIIAKSQEAAP
jgi:hypothetical protein